MGTSAFTGPIVAFGQAPMSSESNPARGPSMFDQGSSLMDPRDPYAYSPGRGTRYGWLGTSYIPIINAVPAVAAANNIALSQTPVAATALTLTAGAGVTGAVSITPVGSNTAVTVLAIDGAAGAVQFGSGGSGNGGPVRIWDPSKSISRCVRIVSVGNDSTATFLVSGYDIYNYPMTQLLTGANAGTATTTKAFKYISSITPAGTLSGSAVTVGTTDVIGLPLLANYWGDISVYMASALVTASTGFLGAVTTAPSTNLLGDVRGTYTLQTASDGTRRLQVFVTPSVANISSQAGLVGQPQV